MLLSATPHLRNMTTTGDVYCINCDFYYLESVQELLPEAGRRIFLLLGNTIGNEQDPVKLLKAIRKVMRPADRLILEAQLLSETSKAQGTPFDKFYMGPFLYAGFGVQEVECVKEVLERPDKDQQICFKVTTKKPKEMSHPRFPRPVTIDVGEYTTHVVRKFSVASLQNIIRNSDLKIVSPDLMPKEDKPSSPTRLFAYLVLSR
jgi:hypothetical protein